MWLFLVLILIIVFFFTFFFKSSKAEEKPDFYSDYILLLNTAVNFREKEKKFAKEVSQLIAFDPDHLSDINPSYYDLSLDGKHLIVKNCTEEEAEQLINEIGGNSYLNGNLVYLTLKRVNDPSEVPPEASFSIVPEKNITTITPLKYDSSRSKAFTGASIVEHKWRGKKPVFKEPGEFEIGLKVKDSNGHWSKEVVKTIQVIEPPGIKRFVAHLNDFIVLYNCGRVFLKGKNAFGELGVGTLNPIQELSYSNLHDGMIDAALSEDFALFLLYDGTVWASGNNRQGQLGNGGQNPEKTLHSIWGLENIKQVVAVNQSSGAVDREGNAFVWGDNSDNQLCDQKFTFSSAPVKIKDVENVTQMAMGYGFVLVRQLDGTVTGWGANGAGQLALGYKGAVNEPSVALYKNVKSIHAGDKFSLALTENGRVYGCGSNTYGQLGMKGKAEVLFPEEVLGIKNVAKLCVRASLVLAITEVGEAYIWGNFNSPGQKPITEPTKIENVRYIQHYANSGKKIYLLDNQNILHTVSDLSGKNEKEEFRVNILEGIQS